VIGGGGLVAVGLGTGVAEGCVVDATEAVGAAVETVLRVTLGGATGTVGWQPIDAVTTIRASARRPPSTSS